MDEKILEAVRTEIIRRRTAEVFGCFRPEAVPQGECRVGDCYCFRQCDREARAAIEAHTAALAEAGFVIVPRTPTMPAMEEIFGRGPVDRIPLAEAKRRFRKAIEVLAAAPAQR
jgi:hypothetical protein